jgi:hypothetical protein
VDPAALGAVGAALTGFGSAVGFGAFLKRTGSQTLNPDCYDPTEETVLGGINKSEATLSTLLMLTGLSTALSQEALASSPTAVGHPNDRFNKAVLERLSRRDDNEVVIKTAGLALVLTAAGGTVANELDKQREQQEKEEEWAAYAAQLAAAAAESSPSKSQRQQSAVAAVPPPQQQQQQQQQLSSSPPSSTATSSSSPYADYAAQLAAMTSGRQ